MNANMKIAVLSGRRMDQGKTSILDNLLSTRLPNFVRIEIESASTGSAKEGVTRIPASDLPLLREALLDLDESASLGCDVGGSEYADFMKEITKYRSTTAEFDRFIFVMRHGGIKESDALKSISELIELGADPSKISIIFNFAPYVASLDQLRANLRSAFPNVFEAAKTTGFHICETPILEAEDLYKTVFLSKKWNIDALAAAPDFRSEIKTLKKEGKPVPDGLRAIELAQEQSRSFAKQNLDNVWSEILSHSKIENKKTKKAA